MYFEVAGAPRHDPARRRAHAKIRLGYVSGEFREQATQIVLKYFKKQGFSVDDKVIKLMLTKIDVNPNYTLSLQGYLEAESQALVKQNKLSAVPDWSKLLNRSLLQAAGAKA